MSSVIHRSTINTRTVMQRPENRGAYIASRYPSAVDRTAYARSIGYTGVSRVLVFDGLVVSHAYQDWMMFCNNLRDRAHRIAA